ncbi:enoyl-CoA hydratase/isomerase family protein [Sinorhizobium meliloti]|uniref:enoyl-CoA hydratase/isomerase family protein n=1 Tax=Rhizobium meliloti TaxID=382 RepID=UPI003F5CF3C3
MKVPVESFDEGRITLSVGSVARLQINRPEKCNAMSASMWSALSEACHRITESAQVRAVVLSGAGGHFCSGADISEFADAYVSEQSAERYNDAYCSVEAQIRDLGVPVIAEVRGACFGGGLGLALSADFRFADATARIAVTASKLGIAYSAEDCARIMEKIGAVRAKDMLFSARTIEAEEALRWGLVDRLVDPERLFDVVDTYANELAARSRASLKAMKLIINSIAKPDASLCKRLRPTYSQLFQGPDLAEGSKAFLEKREPRFV